LTIESGQSARLDDIIRGCRRCRKSSNSTMSPADYDLVLKVIAEDMEAYERFLLLQLMSVGTSRTSRPWSRCAP